MKFRILDHLSSSVQSELSRFRALRDPNRHLSSPFEVDADTTDKQKNLSNDKSPPSK